MSFRSKPTKIRGVVPPTTIIHVLAKPVNDLSCGCSVEDITSVTAIIAVQVQG